MVKTAKMTKGIEYLQLYGIVAPILTTPYINLSLIQLISASIEDSKRINHRRLNAQQRRLHQDLQ